MKQSNKNKLLILGFFLAILIAYQLAFSKTFEIKSELATLEKQSISFENMARLSATINEREKFVDSILKKNNIKNTSIQNNLLELLNKQSLEKGFTISKFVEPHIVSKENITTTSFQFTLKGNFKNLLEVIYQLEQNYNYGKIVHINFEKKRDYRKRKDELFCFVLLESLISK